MDKPLPSDCVSHNLAHQNPAAMAYESLKARHSDPVALDLIKQLNAFPLGRYLIQHGGLNGFWTSYIVNKGNSPLLKNHTDSSPRQALEEWLLNECPAIVATQQRFRQFQKALRRLVQPGIAMASVPCGVMDDLLALDYAEAPNVRLTGIDIDPESLKLAEENAVLHGLQDRVAFISADAWTCGKPDSFDVVTSSGLNIYEPDEARTVALYRNMHRVLKPRGYLVTSYLTPPPDSGRPSPWQNVKLPDLQKQQLVFGDILQVKWRTYRTEAESRDILKKAGFMICDTLYDESRLFPTLVAQRS